MDVRVSDVAYFVEKMIEETGHPMTRKELTESIENEFNLSKGDLKYCICRLTKFNRNLNMYKLSKVGNNIYYTDETRKKAVELFKEFKLNKNNYIKEMSGEELWGSLSYNEKGFSYLMKDKKPIYAFKSSTFNKMMNGSVGQTGLFVYDNKFFERLSNWYEKSPEELKEINKELNLLKYKMRELNRKFDKREIGPYDYKKEEEKIIIKTKELMDEKKKISKNFVKTLDNNEKNKLVGCLTIKHPFLTAYIEKDEKRMIKLSIWEKTVMSYLSGRRSGCPIFFVEEYDKNERTKKVYDISIVKSQKLLEKMKKIRDEIKELDSSNKNLLKSRKRKKKIRRYLNTLMRNKDSLPFLLDIFNEKIKYHERRLNIIISPERVEEKKQKIKKMKEISENTRKYIDGEVEELSDVDREYLMDIIDIEKMIDRQKKKYIKLNEMDSPESVKRYNNKKNELNKKLRELKKKYNSNERKKEKYKKYLKS